MGSKALNGEITPLHIEIALHYYKPQASEAVSYTGRDGDAVAQIHHEFADAGLLEITGDDKRWKATDGMRLYVESLCRVPLPVKQPDITSHLDTILKTRSKSIGEETIKTRNEIISAVMDEYLASTPQSRL